MVKRGRLEIIRDILLILKENSHGIKSTPLLRKTNLSTSRFSEYFQEILAKGFVIGRTEGKEKKFFITEKGMKFLEKYKTIVDFIDEFEL
ncbi:hypothetical protein KA107_02795 [Candidatus Pacearchaeota archaeon]|nr:hypothetical protein [Candidatus Pacearchaeota archaeon]